jgi:hypothetical protein
MVRRGALDRFVQESAQLPVGRVHRGGDDDLYFGQSLGQGEVRSEVAAKLAGVVRGVSDGLCNKILLS